MSTALNQLRKEILCCSKCKTMLSSRKKPVPGIGGLSAKIVIVGLAPGKDGADLTGIPFTRDPSGELIGELLTSAGLSREQDVFITNLVKCNPKDNKGRNRPPSKSEIERCCSYLGQEISIIKPRLIITFGKMATEFFLKKKINKMTEVHGRVQNIGGTLVFPFIHPAYVIRGAYNKEKYLKEFKVLGEFYRDLITQESQMSRLDILLMLIHKGSEDNSTGIIRGKTRLQKLLFLVQNELKKRGYKAKYAFRPYLYGPYSRELYTDIQWLKMEKVVDVKTSFCDNVGLLTDFVITENGKKRIEDLKNVQLHETIEDVISTIVEKYGNMSIAQLVEFVHEEFADYHKSLRKDKETSLINLDRYIDNQPKRNGS